MGLPRGGTLTYHLLAKRKAATANSIPTVGTPKAKAKQELSPKHFMPKFTMMMLWQTARYDSTKILCKDFIKSIRKDIGKDLLLSSGVSNMATIVAALTVK